jgi:hypothetical protein
MYAAFMFYGGTEVLEVTINVLVCFILSGHDMFDVSDSLGSQGLIAEFATMNDT